MTVYDTVIVGGGPAGYTAALYCARAGLSAAVLETLYAGGQMAATNRIENYPGYDEVDGFSLAQRMKEGAERAGAESFNTEVLELHLTETPKRIITSSGEFAARTVILATGAQPRRLGDAREAEFTGRGLGYCATCDGMFYRGKTVVVAGGGNSAVEEALFLSRICQTVYVVHRRDALRADRAGIRALEQAENVHILYERRVAELLGDETLTGVTLETPARESASLSPATACSWPSGACRIHRSLPVRSSSTQRVMWTPTRRRARTFPACSPRATCAASRCARSSRPRPTAR